MRPRTPDQYATAARQQGLTADRLSYGVAIDCPFCRNGTTQVIITLVDGIAAGVCNHCHASAWEIAQALDQTLNGHHPDPFPDPFPTRSPADPFPVPHPLGGERDDQPFPDPFPERSSWLPVDIAGRAANPPAPPTIIDLLYLRKNHVLSGESEALKTWLAVVAAVEEINAGRGVYWVDGDDVGLDDILERLTAFGVDEQTVTERFMYALPDEPLTQEEMAEVVARLEALDCRLVILDGFNPLMVLHRLDPESGTDVERFYRMLDPFKRMPAAVVLTDNVVKAKENRGKFSIGSERKHSKADVHLGMTTISPLVRGGAGKARIAVNKDRPGHLTRPSPGILEITTSQVYGWTVRPDESHRADGMFRPTGLMEKVSRYLEVQTVAKSRSEIRASVTGKGEFVGQAIDCLIAEGYAIEFDGARGARPVRLKRPFREDEETP